MCLSHKEAAGYTDEIYWESVPTQLQTMCLMSEHLHTVILKLFYFLVQAFQQTVLTAQSCYKLFISS